tara:strand:- start:47956 stop:48915 length:960 start_codon:yes stop_codon:yes gene_type:complete
MTPDLQQWLAQQDIDVTRVSRLAGDMGLRQYYRAEQQGKPVIIADASEDNVTNTQTFIAVDEAFAKAGVSVPSIYAQNPINEWLILEDLGDDLYGAVLNKDNADALYTQALASLLKIQSIKTISGYDLPHFVDDHCLKDLQLWREWFVERYLNINLTADDNAMLDMLFSLLHENAANQPQVLMHRDYHCRNLFALTDATGVIDFQSAMLGPITYDAVSLLRDCYMDWPTEKVQQWARQFHAMALTDSMDMKTFTRHFDLMGVQRHLKALGSFAKSPVSDRDMTIRRTLNYVIAIGQQYSELKEFIGWLTTTTENICAVQ